jgi:endonuclease I
MKKMYKHLILLLLLTGNGFLFGQDLRLSPASRELGSIIVDITTNTDFYLVNDGDSDATISSVASFSPLLTVSADRAVVPSGDSTRLVVSVTPHTNIQYSRWFAVYLADSYTVLKGNIEADARLADSYYAATYNLWGEQLQSALQTLINPHVNLGYTGARDEMYGAIDNENGSVECVYTGRVAQFNTRAGATANNFNCEHTWPQGGFNEDEPMRADVFHLFPTDIDANSRRGSYPFGNVVSSTWSVGGSKLGTDASGHTVFEVRDIQKGNSARAILYFLTCYGNQYYYYFDTSWSIMTLAQEQLLRSWHDADPPDDGERARNESIFGVQENRNPYIDHPAFSERMTSLISTPNAPQVTEWAAWPANISLAACSPGDTSRIQLVLANHNNYPLITQDISSNNPDFVIGSWPVELAPGEAGVAEVLFIPASGSGTTNGEITVITYSGNETITVSADIISSLENVAVAVDFGLEANYPNPFNPATTIPFTIDRSGNVRVEIFSITGSRVRTLLNDQLSAGSRELQWDGRDFNGTQCASGMYIVRLNAAGKTAQRKIALLR